MGRGKMERTVAFAMAGIAATLSKLAFDACMFNSQNFGFIKLPDQFTTGSSIMPHKKNPDVFELTRAKCNKLQGLPQQITLISNNLPSGYFRDCTTEVSSEAETESPGATQESETETTETEETQESHEAAEDEESGEEETEDHFVEKKIVVATDMHYFAEKLAGNRCDSFVGRSNTN